MKASEKEKLDILTFQIEEIENADVKDGEEEELLQGSKAHTQYGKDPFRAFGRKKRA